MREFGSNTCDCRGTLGGGCGRPVQSGAGILDDIKRGYQKFSSGFKKVDKDISQIIPVDLPGQALLRVAAAPDDWRSWAKVHPFGRPTVSIGEESVELGKRIAKAV